MARSSAKKTTKQDNKTFKGPLVYSALKTGKSNKPGLNVHLTLRFGEQRYQFSRFGYAVDLYVGIRRSFLNFELVDCSMPDEDWAVDPVIESERRVSRSISDSRSESLKTSGKSSTSLKVEASSGVAPAGKLASQAEVALAEQVQEQASGKTSDQFEQTVRFVSARGGPDRPSWDIITPPGETILRGSLYKNQQFCRVEFTGDEPRAVLSLEVPRDGLVIKDQNGAYDQLPNKRGLTRLLISRAFCKDPLLLAEIDFGDEDDER